MIVACLFLSFLFIEDKVCEIFNGVLMNSIHEGFDASFWDFEVG